jgi:hypothetical protein
MDATSWAWYLGGLIVATAALMAILHVARIGEASGRALVVRGMLAVVGGALVMILVACAVEGKERSRLRREALLRRFNTRTAPGAASSRSGGRPSVLREEVGVDDDEPVPHNTEQALGEESGEESGEPGGHPAAASEGNGAAEQAAGPGEDETRLLKIRRAPPSHEELMDDEHDLAASLGDPEAMVGGTRSSSFATRVLPRRLEATKEWLKAEELGDRAVPLAEAVAYEGMRRFEESTLFAKEAYKTHQYDEPGEGFVGNYVEPTLDSYDMAFQAYSDKPFVPRRSRLSGNAPIHF